ncbi:TetR/AcrR family transcriptional regulator [Bacillus sp. JJ1566]|uniref:TetR/AcrR family transcriptional regulator n=1 Tax=Bacillus sp. JJ1566 TaxID=3122961 RepID=UPI0030000D2B
MELIPENKFIVSSDRKDASKNASVILEAAKKVFAERGYDATIEEVAIEANVGIGTVYRRYNNKKQLANAVATNVISEIYDQQDEILKGNYTAEEKVKKLFACYARISENHKKIHGMIVDMLIEQKENEEFSNTFLKSLQNIFVEVITSGQNEGVFRNGDPRLYQVFLENTINPKVVKELSEIMPLKDTADFLADLALNGMMIQKK